MSRLLTSLPAVALLALGGCFLEPDYTGITCRTPYGCPEGYICDLAHTRCVPHYNACLSYLDCGAHATCLDGVQGWTCTCDLGFASDGVSCVTTDSRLQAVVVSLFTAGTASWQFSEYIVPQTLRIQVPAPADTTRVRLFLTGPGAVRVDGQPVPITGMYERDVQLPVTLVITSIGQSGQTTTYELALTLAPP